MGGVWKYTAVAETEFESTREECKCEMSPDEEDLILRLHKLLGDRWKLIAGRLPWRSAQEIEKYWKMRNRAN